MLSHTLFISDLHLDEAFPAITAHFLNFIEQHARQADALYILGDFFEAWVGDDDIDTPFHQKIIQALHALSRQIPVYFMHGNRDLLIGPSFATASGVILLRDPSVVQLYQRRLLLTHGDRLCTQERGYQFYRMLAHQRWIQAGFLSLPCSLRRKWVKKLRAHSQRRHRQWVAPPKDVSPQAVKRIIQKHQVSLLIHGHTHRPAIHAVGDSEPPQQHRIVLGDWDQSRSVLRYFENGEYVLGP